MPEYVQRMVVELNEVDDRIKKLKDFVKGKKIKQTFLLRIQLFYMIRYYKVLYYRYKKELLKIYGEL